MFFNSFLENFCHVSTGRNRQFTMCQTQPVGYSNSRSSYTNLSGLFGQKKFFDSQLELCIFIDASVQTWRRKTRIYRSTKKNLEKDMFSIAYKKYQACKMFLFKSCEKSLIHFSES